MTREEERSADLQAVWGQLQPTGTPEECLAAILAHTVNGTPRPVPIVAVMEWLRSQNLWLPIKQNAASQTACLGAIAAVDLNDDPRAQAIDFSLPIVAAMLADLVAHALLTQDQAAAMAALEAPPVPWWTSSRFESAPGLGDLVVAGLVPPPARPAE